MAIYTNGDKKLILITDVIEQKVRKERELEFYQKELEKLQEKMFWLRKDIEVTNTIITMIKSEEVYDIKQGMEVRMLNATDDT